MRPTNSPHAPHDYKPTSPPQKPQHKVRGTTTSILLTTLRALQLITALIILGINSSEIAHYNQTPNTDKDRTSTPSADEIYALVVALLSLSTLALHFFYTRKWTPYISIPWDFAMSVLWAALAGRCGTMFLGHAEQEDVRSVQAMRAAVAFELIGVVVWLGAFALRCVVCCREGRGRGGERRDEVGGMESGVVRTEEEGDGGVCVDEKMVDGGRVQYGREKGEQ